MSFSPFAATGFLGRFVFVLAVASIAVASFGSRPSAAARIASATVPIVRTSSGAIRGVTIQNMNAYLGIPYAAPPVGSLRWQPPQPPASWSGVRPATTFANHCPQGISPSGLPSLTEDCLYLNVFVPAGTKSGPRLPVMVWIHGGAFVDGESDDYDPDRLAARGVIVVTLNYRLGYLGFLATSGLDAEAHAHVNYGLLDQQFALAWAHANIAAFGGDPSRTTIFGQSAGGASVMTELLAPSSAGLFSGAIVESGAYDILSLPTLATAQTAGNAIAAAAGCSALDTACLRALTVPQLLQLQAASDAIVSAGGPSPAVDGNFIPQAPQTALARGAFNHVPILQGTNHDEFRFFTALIYDLSGAPLSAAEYPLAVQQTLNTAGLGAFTGAVLAQYPLTNYASPDLAYAALTTDAVFSTPAYVTDLLLSARTPLYAYEFSDENAPEDFLPPVSFSYAAAHASELQFIYDSFARVAPPLSLAEQQLAAKMTGEWTNFAKYQSPGTAQTPFFPRYSGVLDDMEALIAPRPAIFFDFAQEHKTAFWAALAVAGQISSGTSAQRTYLTLDAVRRAGHTLRPAHRATTF